MTIELMTIVLGIQVMGSSLFVACVVLGVIAIAVPFTLTPHDFIRDVIFFLASLVWLFYILLDSSISSADSLGFVIVYIVYIAVVVSGTFTRRDKASAVGAPQTTM
jgi:Ca2+/Na+ antiporter